MKAAVVLLALCLAFPAEGSWTASISPFAQVRENVRMNDGVEIAGDVA